MHIHILLELRLRNAQISGFTDGASPIRSVTGSWIHTSSCTRWLARRATHSLPPRARVVACGGNHSEWCETVHRDAPSSARIHALARPEGHTQFAPTRRRVRGYAPRASRACMGYVHGCVHEYVYGCADGYVDGYVHGYVYGCVDGYAMCTSMLVCRYPCMCTDTMRGWMRANGFLCGWMRGWRRGWTACVHGVCVHGVCVGA